MVGPNHKTQIDWYFIPLYANEILNHCIMYFKNKAFGDSSEITYISSINRCDCIKIKEKILKPLSNVHEE